MGILYFLLLVILLFLGKCIFRPVLGSDVFVSGRFSLLGNPGGICTKIGDNTNRTIPLDINSLIELLRQAHSLLCGKIQHLGRFLL